MTLRSRLAVLSALSLVVVIAIGIVLIVSFNRLVTGSKTVVDGIKPGSIGAQELHNLAVLADWYAVLLLGITALMVFWVAVVTFGLRRDVLRPLKSIGGDLDQVTAGEIERPIAVVGPPELVDLSTDAELMRRALVAQIDTARAAQAGLAQDGPLATAIDAELSTPTDASASGLVVHGIRHAAEGVVSGDWWDVVAMPGGRTGLIVADATGHGPAAGIAALRVKTAARLLLADAASPATVLTNLDRVFQDVDGRFVTLFVAAFDPAAGSFVWANAGHEPALLRRSDGRYESLGATGPLLSRLSGTWTENTTQFGPGDVLVAYTDGLAESRDAREQLLTSVGITALIDSAIAQHGVTVGELVEQLEVDARARAANWANDDFTVVAVGVAA